MFERIRESRRNSQYQCGKGKLAVVQGSDGLMADCTSATGTVGVGER